MPEHVCVMLGKKFAVLLNINEESEEDSEVAVQAAGGDKVKLFKRSCDRQF
jgi:hypothetical protein